MKRLSFKLVNNPLARYFDWLPIGAMLAAGVAGPFLITDWTHHVKRHLQPPYHFWLGGVYAGVFGLALWWVSRRGKEAFGKHWLSLGLLAVLPNAANIYLRYTTPYSASDPRPVYGREFDVSLFYKYGHDLATGVLPNWEGKPMEYPQGALLLFWLNDKLAGGILETFYWSFPAFLLLFHLLAAYTLYGIGHKVGRPAMAYVLAAFASSCPFLMQFYYGRYDIVPSALLLAAVYFFLPPRSAEGFFKLSYAGAAAVGLAIGAGFVVKWLPALLFIFLAAAYLLARRWRLLAVFTSFTAGLSLLVMLPFFLLTPPTNFWYPLQWQSSRHLIGESVWMLVQFHFLDEDKVWAARPWLEPRSILLDNTLLTAVQLVLLGLLLGLSLWRLWKPGRQAASWRLWRGGMLAAFYERWAAVGLLAVAFFILSNRVYSAQFLIMIIWCFVGVLVLRPVNQWLSAASLILLSVAGTANYLAFHLFAFDDQWPLFSLLRFVILWPLGGFLLWKSLTYSGQPLPGQPQPALGSATASSQTEAAFASKF